MSETRRTITFAGVGILLLAVALLTAPRHVTPDAFLDRGEQFFADFTDPNVATTLEVIEFDEETAAARPFKVTFAEGKWSIPSHHDYPADGKDRLAKTAADMIEIRKDDYRSDNVSDHETCGVIDPLDEGATSLKGRGKRVTIKKEDDQILADLIIGRKVEGKEKLYFVRAPGQKRVYVAKLDLEVSTKFEDWIERDLMELEKDDIRRVTLKDYSINERTGTINQKGTLILTKKDDKWEADRMSSSQELETYKMNELVKTVDELSIVGIRPKPEGLSKSLKHSEEGTRLTQSDLMSLQNKGFFFTRKGSLLSNEGELEVETSDGVTYTLRFGEIVYGSGEAITAGSEASDDKDSGPGENRYLFLTTSYQASSSGPTEPRNTDFLNKAESEWSDADRTNSELKNKHDEWKKKQDSAKERSERLNTRFADWYYVISDDSFDKIHLGRSDLIKKKTT